ncbi:MAG: alpha/beta hydrolase [Flavobacteriaceae bacterium]|nr:alpha/beta hydrolase [Flavobacteriaceae bacterium]
MVRNLLVAIMLSFSTICLAQVTTEDVKINNDEIELPGTLTFTSTKVPLLIWVHGSGNVDRNGNQAGLNVGANYIQQFREAINQKGLAFYSFDKRTANARNMPIIRDKGIVFQDFVSDVKETINYFKKDNRFSEIVLIGHSQGSLVAMLASEDADKYVSIAGPAETIDKTIIRQVSGQSAELAELCKSYFIELESTGEIADVDPRLLSLFAKPNQPFFASWMELNPVDEIKKIDQPILLINGDQDLQVPVNDLKQLHESKPKATMVVIKDMNHVLKTVKNQTENYTSYQSPKFKISEELINTIERFVKQ